MIVAHRVNTIEQLNSTPTEYGIEIDIRYDPNKGLVVTHDLDEPNKDIFIQWICHYNHGPLFINIKESRCEDIILEIMANYPEIEWYFLDSQIPDIIRLSNEGYADKFIIRLSRFENPPYEFVKTSAKYVWIDDFGLETPYVPPYELEDKTLVYCSPELHKKPELIVPFINNLSNEWKDKIRSFTVCTDYPEVWKFLC